MKKLIRIGLLIAVLMISAVGVIHAESAGFIQGRIYKDVNGDGKCIDTGVPGEEPLLNINVQFTNSDGDLVITHYSGDNGYFGLVRAGFSWWEVKVLPPAGWYATSDPVLYVPVFEDSLAHDQVNFCLSDGQVQGTTARVVALLPESGTANGGLTAVAIFGLTLLLAGAALEIRRRRA